MQSCERSPVDCDDEAVCECVCVWGVDEVKHECQSKPLRVYNYLIDTVGIYLTASNEEPGLSSSAVWVCVNLPISANERQKATQFSVLISRIKSQKKLVIISYEDTEVEESNTLHSVKLCLFKKYIETGPLV